MADIDPGESRPKRTRRPQAARKRSAARSESESAELDTPDPIEIAMKAAAAGAVPSSAAMVVLEKHAGLIDIQCKREREEWAVLRVQRVTRWLLLSTGLALLAGIAVLLWSASQARTLVIEPFSVPPMLEQRGLTGKVIGARLLDKLADFQRQTESLRPSDSYANNWEDEIQIDIPQTGIALGETWRTLRRWLGEETRIGGELTLAADGTLALTTRAGALSGGTHQGREAELDALITRAAEGIYRTTQPYRFAFYARRAGRRDQTVEVLRELSRYEDPVERKWALNGLGAVARDAGELSESLAYVRAALAVDPDFLPAVGNVGITSSVLGHDEDALLYHRRMIALGRSQAGEYDPRILRANLLEVERWNAERLGDWVGAYARVRAVGELGLIDVSEAARARAFAPILAGVHDHQRAIAAARQGRSDPQASAGASDVLAASIAIRRAIDLRDGAAAAAAADALLAADARLAASAGLAARLVAATQRAADWPLAALGLAEAGRFAEAIALIRRTPLDCYDCVWARGRIAAARGNRREAERWLREAIRQGPSIPMAWLDLARLHWNDRARARALVEEASRRGPAWADPLKYWGDLLALQGDWRGAERRYREAAERAPRWGALQLNWAQALWALGRRAEAGERLRAAAGLELSAADRTRLERMRRTAGAA
jgi:tetratricopeptide (TPR) repeat protein